MAITENQEAYLVYKNRFNEVKPYRVEVIETDDESALVWDLIAEKSKTLKTASILDALDNWEDAESSSHELQKKYEIIPRNRTGKTFANPDRKFEICFTGFSKKDKQELIILAKEAGFFVRTKVTQNLGVLICGKTAGWAKLKEAHQLKVPIISGIDDFEHFVETGEFPE